MDETERLGCEEGVEHEFGKEETLCRALIQSEVLYKRGGSDRRTCNTHNNESAPHSGQIGFLPTAT
jgi:hypothetical protein